MRQDVEKTLNETKVVAIIRGFAPEICLRLAEAYLKGGIRLVEVTFVQTDRTLWSRTTEAIKAMSRQFAGDIHIGAGTVLTAEQLDLMCDAGGEFMVAPNVNPELIAACRERDLASMPGAITPTEVVNAWEAGASFVKVFPAGAMGAAYVKALKTPLAHIPMLAVGGITPDNVAEFIQAGCVGAAVSGALCNKEWIDAGAWDKITDVARRLIERVGT